MCKGIKLEHINALIIALLYTLTYMELQIKALILAPLYALIYAITDKSPNISVLEGEGRW